MDRKKIITIVIYSSIFFTFPGLAIKGIGFVFKCIGGFTGGFLSEMPIPFNPF